MSASRRTALISLVIFGTWVVPATGWAKQAEVDYALWDEVLARYVSDGRVDYAGLMTSRASLEAALYDMAEAVPEDFQSREEQLAFWINAYNAHVLKGVLGHYPVPSVKRIAGFFDRVRYRIGGRELTLNEIESAGRALGDWRLHMALVCASSSCPPLRAEAYVPERLERQLADQTRRFLNDPKRGLRLEGTTLLLSQIFKWYAQDFVPGARRFTSTQLLAVLAPYVEEGLAGAIERGQPAIGFLDYDWSLNEAYDTGGGR
jgi:hypothetical protein